MHSFNDATAEQARLRIQEIDTISWGAPRECFNSVVGPTKFNYLPKKPCDPGPGRYSTSHPYKELGSKLIKENVYTMRGRMGH